MDPVVVGRVAGSVVLDVALEDEDLPGLQQNLPPHAIEASEREARVGHEGDEDTARCVGRAVPCHVGVELVRILVEVRSGGRAGC